MRQIDTRKVVLVGTGFVGMSYAYSLLNQGLAEELVLIDINKEKAIGEAMDLSHGVPYAPRHMTIYAGDYNDCKDADLVVITAGVAQKPGETRLDLLQRNKAIMVDIVESIMKSGFSGIILVASNPVDVMTYVAYKVSGLPAHRVFGSGTSLDSARLRDALSRYFEVDAHSVHAYVIGEHGDSEFVPWSNAFIGIKPVLDVISEHPEYDFADLDRIYVEVRDAAYEIIKRKQATYYGIGLSLAHITRVIFNNSNSIVPVSVYLEKPFCGVSDLYIGLPAVINRHGIKEIITFPMNQNDRERFVHSAAILQREISSLGL